MRVLNEVAVGNNLASVVTQREKTMDQPFFVLHRYLGSVPQAGAAHEDAEEQGKQVRNASNAALTFSSGNTVAS